MRPGCATVVYRENGTIRIDYKPVTLGKYERSRASTERQRKGANLDRNEITQTTHHPRSGRTRRRCGRQHRYTSGGMALTRWHARRGGISEQTHQVFQPAGILKVRPAAWQVVKATCYLKDMNDFGVQQVYAVTSRASRRAPPSNHASVMDVLVEIDLIAYVD